MRPNLLVSIGVVALLAAGTVASMQDPPKPVPFDLVATQIDPDLQYCDNNGFGVSWKSDFSAGENHYVVSEVTLTGVTAYCLRERIQLYLMSDLTNGTTDGITFLPNDDVSFGRVLAVDETAGDASATTGERTVKFNFRDVAIRVADVKGIAVEIPDRADANVFPTIRTTPGGVQTTAITFGQSVTDEVVVRRGTNVSVETLVDPFGTVEFSYCFDPSTFTVDCSTGTQPRTPIPPPVGLASGTPNDFTATATSAAFSPPIAGYYRLNAAFSSGDFTYYSAEDSGGTEHRLVVAKAPTTTAFTASTTSVTWGTPITFTGTVTENVGPELSQPAGNIVFLNGGVAFGSCEVTNNTCSYTTGSLNALPVGTRSITARYVDVSSGVKANYLDSPVSGARSISVFKSDSTTGIEAPASAVYLAPVTITARVRAKSPSIGIPVGKLVTFRDYTTPTGTTYTSIGSCTMAADLSSTSGTCSITTSSLALRDHYLVAVFNATTELNTSASTRSLLSVIQPSTGMTITPSPASPSTYGQLVSFAVAVASSGGTVPNAVIAISDGTSGGTRPLGTCTLNAGSCTFATSSLEVTSHTISAAYPGTASIPSASASVEYVVGRADATTSISASTTRAVVGQPIAFTARVAPVRTGAPTPTGTVDFYGEGAVLVDSCQLVSGTCSISITRPSSGTDGIWATYQGSLSYLSDASDKLVFTYVPAPTAMAGSWTPTTLTYGGAATLTARVTANAPSTSTPTGMVTFSDGTTALGTCALVAGSCSIPWPDTGVSWPAAGSHTLYFRYQGTGDFSAATQSRTLTIAKAASSIDLSSNTGGYTLSLGSIARNSSLTFGTIVSSSVPGTNTRPTGTATFRMTSSTGSVTTLCSAKTLLARTIATSWADCAYKFTKAGTYRVWVAYTPPSISNYNAATLSTAYWISVTVNP